LSDGAVADFLGGEPAGVPKRYAAASPRALLPLGVPQLVVHGTADAAVPYAIGADYHAAAVAAGDEATLLPLAGTGHFDPIDPASRAWPEVEAALVGMTAT
jgi:pimeloyl-ACP methyl ester carboxylesterase